MSERDFTKNRRIKLNKTWHHLVSSLMDLMRAFVDSDGDRWYTKSNEYDEYGTSAGGWELWNYR